MRGEWRWYFVLSLMQFDLEVVFGVGCNFVRFASLHWVHGVPPFHFGNGVIQSGCRIM
jgi:hypothetical protein